MNLEEQGQARRKMLEALFILTLPAVDEPTLKARNLTYQVEEMLKALDAYYRAEDEPAEAGPS